jgi:hypothetical protein
MKTRMFYDLKARGRN